MRPPPGQGEEKTFIGNALTKKQVVLSIHLCLHWIDVPSILGKNQCCQRCVGRSEQRCECGGPRVSGQTSLRWRDLNNPYLWFNCRYSLQLLVMEKNPAPLIPNQRLLKNLQSLLSLRSRCSQIIRKNSFQHCQVHKGGNNRLFNNPGSSYKKFWITFFQVLCW